MPSVLFVCLGNICRSPAAEGILRHLAEKGSRSDIYVESCGLGTWHIGQLPDERVQEATKKRGIILASRAQQFRFDFFDRFDYILAADHEVLNVLHQHAKTLDHKSKLHLMTAFSHGYVGVEVPDPYYGTDAAFESVIDMLEDSCEGLLEHIQKSKDES